MIDPSQPLNMGDLTVVGTFVATAIGVAWKVGQSISSARNAITAEIARVNAAWNDELESTNIQLAELRRDHENFKLEVAREYVSRSSLRELEDRLVAAIERIGDRLDRVFERNNDRQQQR